MDGGGEGGVGEGVTKGVDASDVWLPNLFEVILIKKISESKTAPSNMKFRDGA